MPGLSPHVAPVVGKARAAVTALLQGLSTERTDQAAATPDTRRETTATAALDKPAAAATALDNPPPRPAPTDTAATSATAPNEAAFEIDLAGALAPISLPTEAPPIELRKVPTEFTLAAAAIRPLVMPREAPVVNVSAAPPAPPPQAVEVTPPPPANVSTDRIEPPLPERIEAAASADAPNDAPATGADLMPPEADLPAVVASGEVEVENPQAVLFQSASDVVLKTGTDAHLGLTTPSQPADSGLLLVARGIPPGIRLSKGSRIGREFWFMLAALDVFLGDDVVVQFLVDELHAFRELLVVLHERGLRDAVGGLLLQRLDEDGELQVFRPHAALAAGNDHEIRRVDAVVAEDFLGDALVLAERQARGAAAGERDAVHREKRHDVLVEGPVVPELVGQVEDHVRAEGLQLLPQEIEVVEDGQMLVGIAELAQGGEHAGLGLPVGGLQLGTQILVERRGSDGIKQGENFQFLGHGYFVRLNFPVNK